MRLFVARHGETIWNAEHRLQGQTDIDLSPHGKEQARELLLLLQDVGLDAVFASPLRRSLETAGPIAAAHGLEVEIRSELMEMSYGVLEGRTALDPDPEIRRLWAARKADPLGFRAPGGETHAEVRERVAPFAAEVQRRFAHGCALVVGHRGTNRALLAILLGWSPAASMTFRQKHDQVIEVRPGENPAWIDHRYGPARKRSKG